MRRTRLFPLLAGAVIGSLALAACGGEDDTTDESADTPAATDEAGSGGDIDLSGASFTVGSKDFSEQIILGQITIQLLEAYGAEADDQTNIAGSEATRAALESGDIDVYWEYTGTGWITYLGETTPVADQREQFEAVAAADLEQNGIVWLDPPAPLNNTYAFAAAGETADELGVATLSDVAALDDPASQTFCIESEFASRDDGWPGLVEAYGLPDGPDNVFTLDTGLIYDATGKGDPCIFGEVFATDGRIANLGLTVMEDDLQFFPVYQPALTMRQETADEYPQLVAIFAPVAEKLTTEVMQGLNAQADVDGEDPADIADGWLQSEGLLP
jgi:osmoprotectant transport system substrate-binding protein